MIGEESVPDGSLAAHVDDVARVEAKPPGELEAALFGRGEDQTEEGLAGRAFGGEGDDPIVGVVRIGIVQQGASRAGDDGPAVRRAILGVLGDPLLVAVAGALQGGSQRVHAGGDLGAVGHGVAVGVGVQGVGAERDLLAVRESVAVGVEGEGIGARVELPQGGQAVAVGVGRRVTGVMGVEPGRGLDRVRDEVAVRIGIGEQADVVHASPAPGHEGPDLVQFGVGIEGAEVGDQIPPDGNPAA